MDYSGFKNELKNYYHGECVAMGMLYMCSPAVRERLIPVLEKLSLPVSIDYSAADLIEAIGHDKKMDGKSITVAYVPAIGSFDLRKLTLEELETAIREVENR